ncbi:TetR family transcriptional regulator [Kocuria flava]|uniref:TetR family transcriptional regulator n=1 Tax=Kocuria flava TaxID=446860 RepID=A0A0U3HTE6_9MICC|nr:TetR/AcrR family transcriptional regulator [Kocuria flava]ALU38591.1 TetR family transcriptional regulator [Kocuria flava]GEO93239.1 TetR family transcriptional regulator [Kocuria flava]
MTHAPAPAAPAGETPRRGRPGYDRETLLSVCVEVFNVHGYDATSMGTLSKHLGISKSAIYHHVASKEEILEQALARALDALEEVLAGAAAAEGPAVARLEQVIRGTVRVLVEQMPYVTLLLRLRGNSEVETRALERRRTVTRRVGELIEQAQAEGAVRDDLSGRSAARLLLGMINSIVDWYRPEAGDTTDQLADTVVGLAFSGLRAP